MAGVQIGLDNPVLAGRIRRYKADGYLHRPAPPVHSRLISDVRAAYRPKTEAIVQSQRSAAPPLVKELAMALRPSPDPAVPSNRPRAERRRSHASPAKPNSALPSASKIVKRFKLPHLHWPSFALRSAAVVVVGLGLAIGFNGLHVNHQVQVQASRLEKDSGSNTTPASDVPSETKPTNVGSYQVAPTLPRFLIIPKLGVNARVLRLGVTTNNALATPPNIFDAGWYDESSGPGQPGATLIDGHVSGPTQHGVFYGLKNLVPGDTIQLERGDGKIFTYKVVTSKVYDANNVDMTAALTPIIAGKPGLNLITCTGQLDATKTHFQQRVMVFAALQ